MAYASRQLLMMRLVPVLLLAAAPISLVSADGCSEGGFCNGSCASGLNYCYNADGSQLTCCTSTCDNCDLLTGKPPGSSPTPSPTSGPTPSPTSGSTPSPAPGTTASPTSSPIPASNGCQTGGVCSGSCAAGLNYCYNADGSQLTCCTTTCDVCALGTGGQAADITFTVLHNNDVHGRVQASDRSFIECNSTRQSVTGDCYGGYAKMATIIDQERAKDLPVLVVNAGDEFTGTLWSLTYLGKESSTFLNLLGFDVMTFGNHEFDKGPQVLADYIGQLNLPIVGSNTVPSPNSPIFNKFPTYKVLSLKDKSGLEIAKVGICGWVTPETKFTSSPGPDINFADVIPAVTSCVNTLNSQGVKIVIGLGHGGIADDLVVAASVPGLSLVVGGHSHTFLYSGVPPKLNVALNLSDTTPLPYPINVQSNFGYTVPYVQDFWGGRYMGRFTVTFDAAGRFKDFVTTQPILLGGSVSSSNIPEKASVSQLIASLSGPVDALNQEVIGSSTVALNGRPYLQDPVTGPGSGEINLGDLITDAMVWKVAQNPNFEAQFGANVIAVTNTGGVRVNLPPGTLTRGQILTVLPFGNVITIIQMSGATLRSAIEFSVGLFTPTYAGNQFLQVSGIRFSFDPSKPAGSRLLELLSFNPAQKCFAPVDDTATYNVISNDFTAGGGDGFSMFATSKKLLATGPVLADVLAEYIQNFSPINIQTDKRINVITPNNAFVSQRTCARKLRRRLLSSIGAS